MIVQTLDDGDVVCEHGIAVDVHCCNCHSGFLFDASACVCSMKTYAILRRDGLYYRRGPVPHWTDNAESATVFNFRSIAELEALRELSSYDYDVVKLTL